MRHALLRRRRLGGSAPDPDPTFITAWETTTDAGSITLPLVSTGTYDMVVDWGDGSSDTITAHTDAARIHEYATAGAYEVRIEGTCKQWNFQSVSTSKDKILDVKNWGNFEVVDGVNAFRDCTNLDVTAADAPDFSGVTSLNSLFRGCPSLAGGAGFNLWDVSSVTNMFALFWESSLFNADISSWNVSSVTTFYGTFRNTTFDQDISGWDVSSGTQFAFMFAYSTFNQDISGWNIQPTDLRWMFLGASNFDQDLGGWDISQVNLLNEQTLSGTNLSTDNYDSLLIGWAAQSVQPNLSFGAGNSTYSSAAADARDTLTSAPNNWTITDGGQAP